MTLTTRPKIYHITHLDNLTGIISEERLWLDEAMLEKDRSYVDIGMKAEKQKRSEHRVICQFGAHIPKVGICLFSLFFDHLQM